MIAREIENADGSVGKIISLDDDEVKKLCRPGEGPDTCIWLVMGEGWECLYYNRRAVALTGEILEDRWKKGLTVAKRDGCDEVRRLKGMNKIRIVSILERWVKGEIKTDQADRELKLAGVKLPKPPER